MKRIFAAALLLAGLGACGGGNSIKEYVVAINSPTTVAGQNAVCGSADTNDFHRINDNADFHVIVYQGDKDHWYAEVPDLGLGQGASTLEGTLTNGTYTFAGLYKEDTYYPDLATKSVDEIRQSTVNITLKDSGANDVSGTFTIEQLHQCNNIGGNTAVVTCDVLGLPNADGNTEDCITTGSFQGVELASPEFKQASSTPGSGGVGSNF